MRTTNVKPAAAVICRRPRAAQLVLQRQVARLPAVQARPAATLAVAAARRSPRPKAAASAPPTVGILGPPAAHSSRPGPA